MDNTFVLVNRCPSAEKLVNCVWSGRGFIFRQNPNKDLIVRSLVNSTFQLLLLRELTFGGQYYSWKTRENNFMQKITWYMKKGQQVHGIVI